MIREFKDSDILRIDKLGKSLFDNYDYNKKNEKCKKYFLKPNQKKNKINGNKKKRTLIIFFLR